jgi:hypothetical protein
MKVERGKYYPDSHFFEFYTDFYEKIAWCYIKKRYDYYYYGGISRFSYETAVVCNGIIITKDMTYTDSKFLYDEQKSDEGKNVITQRPSIFVTDKEGIFPVKLDRNSIDCDILPFEDDLLMEVSKHYIAQLLKIEISDDFKPLKLIHNADILYEKSGFILNFDWFIKKAVDNKYNLIRILTSEHKLEKQILQDYENCFFGIEFDKEIKLTHEDNNVAPSLGGRILLRRKNFDSLFNAQKKRLPKYITSTTKTEDKNKNFIIYTVYGYKEKPVILQGLDTINKALLSKVVSIQELSKDYYKLKGGKILNELLDKYFKDNYIIPYDIDKRKEIYKTAFDDLEKYMVDE